MEGTIKDRQRERCRGEVGGTAQSRRQFTKRRITKRLLTILLAQIGSYCYPNRQLPCQYTYRQTRSRANMLAITILIAPLRLQYDQMIAPTHLLSQPDNDRACTPTINRPTGRQALCLTTITTAAGTVLPPGQTAAMLAADSDLTVAALPAVY